MSLNVVFAGVANVLVHHLGVLHHGSGGVAPPYSGGAMDIKPPVLRQIAQIAQSSDRLDSSDSLDSLVAYIYSR